MLTSRMYCFARVHVSLPLRCRLAVPGLGLYTRSCTHMKFPVSLHKLPAGHTNLFNRTIVTSSTYLQKLSSSYKKPSVDHTLKHTSHDKSIIQQEEKVGIFKRFKNAYKEHGKVLVAVHLVTSTVWMSVFYYAAASGLDLVPLLEKFGAGDKVIEIAHSSFGNLAVAYLMYKLATPARYTVTLFGTFSTVKHLRKLGYMKAPDKKDSIRELVKDSRTQMKEKYGDVKDKIGDVKGKIGDWKDEKLKKNR